MNCRNRHAWLVRTSASVLAAGTLLLAALPLLAAVPTEVEWQLWPQYCRARFTVAGDGTGTEFELRVPKQEVAQWQASIGQAWEPMHHYCYGLLFINRAQSESDADQRYHLLSNAIGEFTFAYRRVESSSPFFGEYASKLALAYERRGDVDSALLLTNDIISRAPNYSGGYVLKSAILRKQRDFAGAAKVLQEGLAAVGENAVDLHYALGLTLVDLDDIEGATRHAERAYALGYPLPGLRNKLRSLGTELGANR